MPTRSAEMCIRDSYSAVCSLPHPDKPAVYWFQQLQLFPIISRKKHRVNSCVYSHLLTLNRLQFCGSTCADQSSCFALRRWIHFTSSTMGTTSTLKSSATRYSAGSTLVKPNAPASSGISHTAVAVSYTHLDVYKRQTVRFPHPDSPTIPTISPG